MNAIQSYPLMDIDEAVTVSEGLSMNPCWKIVSRISLTVMMDRIWV